MSKGKNLAFIGNIYGYCGPFALVGRHTLITDSAEEHRMDVITGPAIDRLHEFEKLGLEPEEIKRQLNDYEEVRTAYSGCCHSCYDLYIELQNKENAIKALQERNDNQYRTICELVKEIERLREQLDDTQNKLGCIKLVLKEGVDKNE